MERKIEGWVLRKDLKNLDSSGFSKRIVVFLYNLLEDKNNEGMVHVTLIVKDEGSEAIQGIRSLWDHE